MACFTPVPDTKVAHVALDASRIGAPATSNAAPAGYLLASKASRHAGRRSGGAACGSLRLMRRTAEAVWVNRPGAIRLDHESADGKVRRQQTPQRLLDQIGRLASQHHAVGPKVGLEFVKHALDFPALVMQCLYDFVTEGQSGACG